MVEHVCPQENAIVHPYPKKEAMTVTVRDVSIVQILVTVLLDRRM